MASSKTTTPTAAAADTARRSARARSSGPPPAPAAGLAAHDQQQLLDVFADALHGVLSSPRLPALLRDARQALFQRDFAAAFASPPGLEAYAARWSPTRALAYAAVLRAAAAAGFLPPVAADGPPLAMLALGGAAAELVAFASLLRHTASRGALALVDSAPWSHVTSLLQSRLTSGPLLSKYASAAARAASQPFLPASQLSVTSHHADALSLTADQLADMAGAGAALIVTLLFTLNELYADGGVGKTTRLLRSMGEALPHGSLLLVVDSPGSYSETALGKEKKRYPMQWLLDHTLLKTETQGYEWEKLVSQDSVWFRLHHGLSYPIQLEDMRYQMHLYRIHKPPRPSAA